MKTMKNFVLIGLFGLGLSASVPVHAQDTTETTLTKKQLKKQEKADKAQGKADKAERKALNTRQQKKADKAQDKADREADKAATPPS